MGQSFFYAAPELLKRRLPWRSTIFDSSIDYYALARSLFYLWVATNPDTHFDRLANAESFTRSIPTYLEEFSRSPEQGRKLFADLLLRLTKDNPKERIGNNKNGDISDIKNHPFFEGVDWKLVGQRKNPVPESINIYISESSSIETATGRKFPLLGNEIGKLVPASSRNDQMKTRTGSKTSTKSSINRIINSALT